ncbi:alpha/beta hydrolase fold domain-containing protein [Corynebacterium ammoniagenes]|uniref:alpha/beta hydrolase n=1 Tax=Corynebacterium ammoniagenes TaxID=1697 RepID=UPI0014598FEF|nr:alpha/beta hydrolase fold domain-containing protein [Corynebacterium ammoniagenes]NMF32439.1 alpha/beta hydrolase fold domain-containing protein [Corynebacterium ammoniagenes]
MTDTVNDGDNQQWHIGGYDHAMSQEDQLEQLYSQIEAHFPLPDFTPPWKGGLGDPTAADNYSAKLTDRITQAAMMVLGSAVDHSMPGVAFTEGIEVTTPIEKLTQFTPAETTSTTWIVSFHSGGWWRGSGAALEMQWQPEVAAVANLAGVMAVDVDYPLAPQHTVADMVRSGRAAIEYARNNGAEKIVLWGYSSGAALAALLIDAADALILTYPDFAALDGLPDDIRGEATLPDSTSWPTTYLQTATHDEVVDASSTRAVAADAPDITWADYVSRHRISTPEVARQRVQDIADLIKNLAA